MRLALLLFAFAASLVLAGQMIPAAPIAAPVGSTPTPKPRPPVSATPSEAVSAVALPASFFGQPEKPEDLLAAERAAARPDFTLVGIIGSGEQRRAIFRFSDGRPSSPTNVKSLVGEWRLDSFDRSCATLRRAKREATLCL